MKVPMFFAVLTLIIAATIYRLNVDESFFHKINKKNKETLDYIMFYFTQLGSVWFIASICVVLLIILFKQNKHWAILIPSVTALSSITNSTLKIIFKRNRPLGRTLVVEKSYSFPSGHAMVSTSFYLTLAYFITRHTNNPIIFIIASILIAIISYSRVYLGVHYPIDVLVGIGLGLIVTVITFKIYILYVFNHFL